ncbi:hypothetical protein [Almyronema epifaneia]|uniref:Uncharacterized protein n=1 Tax=Almyronema epifaneia S1 TaxID=2991925 RepID=A0ABW6IAD2_9CYAN
MSEADKEGKQTPLEPESRRTGQGERDADVREGAKPEAPGDKGRKAGSPNQGTEAR